MPVITSASQGAPVRPSARMAWLDGLRGYAAVVVALFHLSPLVLGMELHREVLARFDLGRYGVLLFFLVSGYVIPMSLERHGSLRRFWVGRLFRIYPAYLLTIAVVLALSVAGVLRVSQRLQAETVTGVLGHATMLHEFVGLRGLIWPFWTLSFEMLFYLIVAGLFVWNLHRLSAWWAAGLAVLAAVAGPRLPDALLAGGFTDRRILAAVLFLLVTLSLMAYVSGRRFAVRAAAVVGMGMLTLPLLNGHATKWVTAAASWHAISILSVLFAGTVIYRAHQGQLDRRVVAGVLTLVLAGSMLTSWLHTGRERELIVGCATSLAVAVTFAAAFALRHRSVPRVMSWLGEVSYSLYLLHMVVVYVITHFVAAGTRDSVAGRAGVVIAFTAGTLFFAWLSYRFVELPGQTLGRHVQRRLDTLLGPDVTRPHPVPRPSRPVGDLAGSGAR